MLFAIPILFLFILLALWAYAGAEVVADRVVEAMAAADDGFFFDEEPGLPQLETLSLVGVGGPGRWSARGIVAYTRWLEGHPLLQRLGWLLLYGALAVFLFINQGVNCLRRRRQLRWRGQLLREVVRAHLKDGI